MFPHLCVDGQSSTDGLEIADGTMVPLSGFCQKRKRKSDSKCVQHYNSLAHSTATEWSSCPYGYSSYRFVIGDRKYAITGILPVPKMRTPGEKERLADAPEQRVARKSVESNVVAVSEAANHIEQRVSAEMTRNLAALHEVVKYNRNVRQTLERVTTRGAADDRQSLMRAWKLSELMSRQFEVLALIADGNLTKIPTRTTSEVYRVFDKCIRIYEGVAAERDVELHISGDSPRAMVSEKTFPIIATVLISNAVKYSPVGSDVEVEIRNASDGTHRVSVMNSIDLQTAMPQDPFQRGVRGIDDGEGSGVGLWLAQQVAIQHGTSISLQRTIVGGATKVVFSFSMRSV
jgi:signal transduction histidine kinase